MGGGFFRPILVVTSHASTRDRIRALDAGADDFLTRPFLMGELLAELFLLHPGQILTRGLLHQKVWGCDYEPSYNELEVYLSFMRRKLRTVGSLVQIHAARGLGYYLKILDDAAPEAP